MSGFSTSGPVTSATLAGVLSRALVRFFGLHYGGFVIQIIVANVRILLTFSENIYLKYNSSREKRINTSSLVGVQYLYLYI